MYHTAITASPHSYSEVCDTARPRIGYGATMRADLGSETFVHFFKPGAMLNSLVRQLGAKGRPANIVDRLRHAGSGERTGIDVADHDVIEGCDDGAGTGMQVVQPLVGDLGMDGLDTPLLARTLRHGQRRLGVAVEMGRGDGAAVAQGGQFLQAQVDADATRWRTGRSGLNFDDNIEIPVAAPITRKIRAIKNFSFGQRPGMEHAKRVAGEPEGIAFALQFPSLQRHPRQGFPAAITQVGTVRQRTGLGIPLTDIVHRAGMQSKLLTASRRQLDQVESRMPASAETQGILLPVVAVVPDKIDGPRLPVQQASQRFDAVSVDQFHVCLTSTERISSVTAAHALTPAESVPFTPRPEGRGFSEQI